MKTTFAKQIISLLGLVMLFTNLSAQSDTNNARKKMCDEVVKKSQYIFVGKPISSKCIKVTSGGIYTLVLMDVQKIISGFLKKGTVEIYKEGGTAGGETVLVTDDIQMPDGLALYFCIDAGNDAINSGVSNTNSKVVKIWDIVSISGNKISGQGIGKYFSSLPELYNYLSVNYSINIAPSDVQPNTPADTTKQR
jgi:hypothetical protein